VSSRQHDFTNAAISMPVAGSSMNEPTREMARQLAAAGWLAIDGAGDIMLSDKSRSDKRFVLRENGLLDIVPLAKKELGDVTAVRANPDGPSTPISTGAGSRTKSAQRSPQAPPRPLRRDAERHREPDVERDGVGDDLGREAVGSLQ
jgi:hypothetical protein